MALEGKVVVSCHEEFPVDSIVQSEVTEPYEFGTYHWMQVKLTNGINRDVLVKELKQL